MDNPTSNLEEDRDPDHVSRIWSFDFRRVLTLSNRAKSENRHFRIVQCMENSIKSLNYISQMSLIHQISVGHPYRCSEKRPRGRGPPRMNTRNQKLHATCTARYSTCTARYSTCTSTVPVVQLYRTRRYHGRPSMVGDDHQPPAQRSTRVARAPSTSLIKPSSTITLLPNYSLPVASK